MASRAQLCCMPFWKRSSPTDHEAVARAEYQALRGQAAKAGLPADRARLLNLAGDIALSIGDVDGGMTALGEALDLYLRDHQYHPARAVARKLLRVRANTVRVRSTLAWLAIAHEIPADAIVALDLYMHALQTEQERQHAVAHLSTMAGATDDRALRTAIAEHLRTLDALDEADRVRERLRAEAAGEIEVLSQAELRACREDAIERLVSPRTPPQP